MSLRKYFDFNLLEIKLPPDEYNDLSDAHENEFSLKNWYNKQQDKQAYLLELKSYIQNNSDSFKSKDVSSLCKLLDEYEES
jgi:hypothetical protein